MQAIDRNVCQANSLKLENANPSVPIPQKAEISQESLLARGSEPIAAQSRKMDASASAVFSKKSKSTLNLSYSHSAIIKEYARNLCNLEEIDFSYSTIKEDSIISAIPDLSRNNPSLKKLNLKGTHLNAETSVKLIMAFPNLEALDLTVCEGINHDKIVKAVISLMKENGRLKSIKGLIFDKSDDLMEFAKCAKNLEKLTLKCVCSFEDRFEEFILTLAKNSPDLKQFHFWDWMRSICLTKELFYKFPVLWRSLEDVYMNISSCMTSLERYDVYVGFYELSTLYCTGFEVGEIVALIRIFARQLEKIIISNEQPDKYLSALFSEAADCKKLRKLDLRRISFESFDELPIPPSVLSNLEYLNLNWSSLKANHWHNLTKSFGNDRVKKLNIELLGDKFDPKVVVIAVINIANRCLRLESLSFKMYGYQTNLYAFRDLNLGSLRNYHLNGVLDSRVKVYGKKDSIQLVEA